MKSFLQIIQKYIQHIIKKNLLLLKNLLESQRTKCMTLTSKKVYIDNLDNLVNKYNNTYHSTIQIKPLDVKSNIYVKCSEKN